MSLSDQSNAEQSRAVLYRDGGSVQSSAVQFSAGLCAAVKSSLIGGESELNAKMRTHKKKGSLLHYTILYYTKQQCFLLFCNEVRV